MQRIQPASPPFCLAIKLSLKSNRSTVRGAVHVVVGDSEARPRSECMSGERRGGGGGGGGVLEDTWSKKSANWSNKKQSCSDGCRRCEANRLWRAP